MKKKQTQNHKKFLTEPKGLSVLDKRFLYSRAATIAEANIFHAIKNLLKKNQGRPVSNIEIREFLDGKITRGTVLYHLNYMIGKGIISKTEKGSFYFINGE